MFKYTKGNKKHACKRQHLNNLKINEIKMYMLNILKKMLFTDYTVIQNLKT